MKRSKVVRFFFKPYDQGSCPKSFSSPSKLVFPSDPSPVRGGVELVNLFCLAERFEQTLCSFGIFLQHIVRGGKESYLKRLTYNPSFNARQKNSHDSRQRHAKVISLVRSRALATNSMRRTESIICSTFLLPSTGSISQAAFFSTSSGLMGFSGRPRQLLTCSRNVVPSFKVTSTSPWKRGPVRSISSSPTSWTFPFSAKICGFLNRS